MASSPLELPACDEPGRHVYHLFVVQTDQRDSLREHLTKCGIETGIHYPIPLHLQPALHDLGYGAGDFPSTEPLASRSLSLLMFPEMAVEDVEAVTAAIAEFFGRNHRGQG